MTCNVESCTRPVQARRMCIRHYKAAHRSGAFTPRRYQGRIGRRLAANGYIYVWAPNHPLAHADGYVAEHRMVVHDAGVPVPPGHHVHHINGDKADNRVENLAVVEEAEHHRSHVVDTVTNQHGTFPRRAR